MERRQDKPLPPEPGRRMQAGIAGSHFVLFDDLGHVPHEGDAAHTVLPVRGFLGLKQLRPATPGRGWRRRR